MSRIDFPIFSSLGAQGMMFIVSTPEAFARTIDQEMVRWAKVVRETGARAD